MKKTIKTILCTLALAVLAVSCQKEINEVEPNTKETIEISINGLMGEYTQVDATKSSLVNTVRVSWENGDIVYVYDGTQCLGSLVASIEGTEDRYAILSTDENHTVTTPTAGTKLTLVHSPLLTEAPAVSEGAISISLANQNGTKAPFVTYATLDYNDEESINNAIVPFKFATSVIKVNCTGLKAGTAIDNATLSNVNTACKLTLSETAAPTVSGDVKGIITRTGDAYFAADKVKSEGVAVFQIATPVLEAASKARVLAVKQELSDYYELSYYYEYINFSKKSLPVATSVNTVCQMFAVPAGALRGAFTVSNDYGVTETQIFFSQGNLWYGKVDGAMEATFNFESNQNDCNPSSDGAVKRDAEHVSHFFWCKNAESAIKEDYDCDQSSNDVFFTNADGFTVNVRGVMQTGWRTLSTNEWQYLFNTHSSKWATVNGVNGYVIAPDDFAGTLSATYADDAALAADNLVFLPAMGSYSDSFIFGVGLSGNYWSSSTNGESQAYCASFGSNNARSITASRDNGYSIRLVRDCK